MLSEIIRGREEVAKKMMDRSLLKWLVCLEIRRAKAFMEFTAGATPWRSVLYKAYIEVDTKSEEAMINI